MYGLKLTDEDFAALLQALDPDNDDRINYTDWLAATLEPHRITSDKALEELFNFFDIHGKGEVSYADLCEVVGEHMASEVAVQAHADATGCISKEHFRHLLIEVAKRLELQIKSERDRLAFS